ncbi:unnamed protein product [Didymodactylos carnosus]|uniref:Transcription elongation regulator 1 n=1 Tax=Didymodactylos carnosus TaxID=1234261 RepID=A0A814JR18_9BILA|nr:unnamed protein product [Didymodactylos carnosus]CAF3810908.1 unnamed protein product [Didymodactylos carnosus]
MTTISPGISASSTMSIPSISQTQSPSAAGATYSDISTTNSTPLAIPLDLSTLWVEYKSTDGRVYYYNAKTRDTTWTKPDGQRVMSQEEVDKLLANPSAAQAESTSSSPTLSTTSTTRTQTALGEIVSDNAKDEKTLQASQDQTRISSTESKNVDGTSPNDQTNQQPSTTSDQSAYNTGQRYSYPPTGMMPPFGMPPQAMMSMMGMMPPHLLAHMSHMMPPGFPYMPPNPQMMRYPFMMPPFMHQTPGAIQQQTPSSSTKTTSSAVVNAELQKLKQQLNELEDKLSAAKNDAAVWSEYKNPEERAYYYNSKTTESTWDKPLVFTELVELQEQIDSLKKNIQQSEEEAKRLEQETNTIGNAAKVTDDRISSFVNGYTVEKMDINDIRRMNNKMDSTTGLIGPEERRTDDEKSKQKSRPISSIPVSGTPWCIVWTSDGKAFYHNPTQHLSLWDKPEDLIGRTDVDTILSEPPKQVDPAVLRAVVKKKLDPKSSEDEPESKKLKSDTTTAAKAKVEQTIINTPSSNTSITNGTSRVDVKKEDDEEEGTDGNNGENVTTNTSNTYNSVSLTTDDSTSKIQPTRIAAGKDAAIEAEAKAAQQRAVVPYETRMKQFREMLAEKEVSAFATWEKELNKIVFDPRYLLLTAKERRQEFDKFVKERADEERKEKAAKLKMKKKQFHDLLKDANLSTRTTFNEFSSRYGKDERFRAIEKSRDREAWFQEYLIELKRREKEDRYSDKEKLKTDFFSMLKPLKLTRKSSWFDIKRTIEHDQRYKAIDSSSKRENWFQEFLSKYAIESEKTESKTDALSEADEEEKVRQREKEKQERIDASIKKRTEEVKEQLSTYQRELEKEREQLKKEKAVENFKALLTDMVRTPDVDWKDTKKLLHKDQRWEQCKQLEREHRENLFDEHINQLQKKRKTAFHQLLNEKQDIVTLTSTWKEVKKAIKNDPRFEKFSTSDKKKEKEFDEYIKQKYLDAKNDFKELLRETKVITHKSLQMINESEQQLRDIEIILKNDKRYLSLDVAPEERKKALMSYLEEIAVKGPPPPPTASEPNSRRKIQ